MAGTREEPAVGTVPQAGRHSATYAPYTSQGNLVSEYWQQRYEREAAKNWDLFYARNHDRFFKDRHYLQAEWSELKTPAPTSAVDQSKAAPALTAQAAVSRTPADAAPVPSPSIAVSSAIDGTCDDGGSEGVDDVSALLRTERAAAAERLVLLEAGCGVGNTAFPLLRAHPGLFVFALDFSTTAVRIVQAHELHTAGRIRAAVGDLATGSLPKELSDCQADVATLMFVLSAISPPRMGQALCAVHSGLRAGGVVLFRDYGAGDGAQHRLASRGARQLDESARFFVRQDGTRAYFFCVEELVELFDVAGFDAVECKCCLRQTVNRQKGISLERRFVTGRFRKRRQAPHVQAASQALHGDADGLVADHTDDHHGASYRRPPNGGRTPAK